MPTRTSEAPRVLLIGVGTLGQPYLDRAHRRGARCAAVDWPDNHGMVGPLLGEHDGWYPISGRGDDAWHTAGSRAVADGPVAAVVAFAEDHVLPAALIAADLGLPGPGLLAAQVSRNKLLQRNLLARNGIRQPGFALARDAETAAQAARERYPVVLKPLAGQGSVGVRVVRDEGELRDWVGGESRGRSFLVERYLAGPEFSCEAIVYRGEIVFANLTEKLTTEPPYCVELGHVVPAACPDDVAAAMRAVTAEVVRAIRMSDGIVHLELKSEPDGPYVVEFAVRTPGDRIMDVIELATGMDLYDAVVAVAMGLRPALPPDRGRAAGVWYPEVEPGRVVSVTGLPGDADVFANRLKLAEGQVVPPLRSSNERVGSLLLVDADRTDLDNRLQRLRGALRVTVEPMEQP